jgi:putative transposase
LSVEGKNCHDMKMVGDTLKSIQIKKPYCSHFNRLHMCMDKGYDYPDVREIVREWGYTAHIKSRVKKYQRRRKYLDIE